MGKGDGKRSNTKDFFFDFCKGGERGKKREREEREGKDGRKGESKIRAEN